MMYGFSVESVTVKKGKISREEKADVISYINDQMVVADDAKKAFRILASRINGRLSKETTDSLCKITLPDYGNALLEIITKK